MRMKRPGTRLSFDPNSRRFTTALTTNACIRVWRWIPDRWRLAAGQWFWARMLAGPPRGKKKTRALLNARVRENRKKKGIFATKSSRKRGRGQNNSPALLVGK